MSTITVTTTAALSVFWGLRERESTAAVIVFAATVLHASKTGCRWLGPWGSGWGSWNPGCQMWLHGMVNKRAGLVANHLPAGLFGA